MVTSIATSIGLAVDSQSPPDPKTPDSHSGEALAAVAVGGLAVLTGYSMVVGFNRSSECRDATQAAGIEPDGSRDWVWPWVILFTVGGAALISRDPDQCSAGAVRTAVCRDGWYSCSLNRSGTCSHHGGVDQWL